MKKLIKLCLLMFVCSLMFVGCTKDSGVLDVGIIFPGDASGRWEQDKAQFEALLSEQGFKAEVITAEDSAAEEEAATELLNKGIKVLVYCPLDGEKAASVCDKAKYAGVKVISYDRLIRNTNAVDYYVTFDSEEVGSKQGFFIVDNRPASEGIPLYLYGGSITDNNAFLFFEGAWEALQPYIVDGTFVIANSNAAKKYQNKNELEREEISEIFEEIATGWDAKTASDLARRDLNASNLKGDICILAPNDTTSRAIGSVFLADKNVSSMVITGQDAEAKTINAIINGKQSMTVFKNTKILAKDTCETINKIFSGKHIDTDIIYDNGVKEVIGICSPITVVTKDNYIEELVDIGYYTEEDIQNAGF